MHDAFPAGKVGWELQAWNGQQKGREAGAGCCQALNFPLRSPTPQGLCWLCVINPASTRSTSQGDVPAATVPTPQQLQRPVTQCGVRAGWLRAWARDVVAAQLGPDATTASVCAQLVIPHTRAHKCRYVDIMGAGDVGLPRFFISHNWSVGGSTRGRAGQTN